MKEAAQEGKSQLGYRENSGMRLREQQKDLEVSMCSELFEEVHFAKVSKKEMQSL